MSSVYLKYVEFGKILIYQTLKRSKYWTMDLSIYFFQSRLFYIVSIIWKKALLIVSLHTMDWLSKDTAHKLLNQDVYLFSFSKLRNCYICIQ